MKVIVVGYGRMGRELAMRLQKDNHEVVVIDSDVEVFDKEPDVPFEVHIGLGFDKQILEESGIERVDAVVACTSSDESNAVIARVARNIYRVPQVIARLYDPSKAAIYDMLGIQTISTTDWGIKRAMKLLEYSSFDSMLSIGDSDVEVLKISVPPMLVGKSLKDLSTLNIRIVGMLRDNKGMIPSTGALFEANDTLYIAIEHDAIPQLRSMLGL